MHKVLVVDDEILVRIGIKSIMNWEEKGYTVAGEASNGREALEIMKADCPDILLTDLMMEPVNGFELIKTVRRDHPAVKIIVLSCYNDFENVKEAMKLGACDYIFKLTLKPDELLKVLDAAAGQITPVAVKAEQLKTDRIVLKNMNAIKGRMIKTAIERSYAGTEAFLQELAEIGIRLNFRLPYFLQVFSIDEFELFKSSSKIKEEELLKFSVQNIISEVMEHFEQVEVFNHEGSELVAVIPAGSGKMEDSFVKALTEAFATIREFCRRYLGIDISAGISRVHSGAEEVGPAYREAFDLLKNRFYTGNGHFHLQGGNGRDSSPEENVCPKMDLSALGDCIEHLEESKIRANICSCVELLHKQVNVPAAVIRSKLQELLYCFIPAARKRAVDLDELSDENGYTPFEAVNRYENMERIGMWFDTFIGQFVGACRKKSEDKCREEILVIKDFIRTNMDKPIDIATASRHVNMSESYFSHFFKKETGISFIDYVNKAKVEKAKELMLQTDFKIYEVASMVGFDNANYFSMLFKKMTGKSPNEYRK